VTQLSDKISTVGAKGGLNLVSKGLKLESAITLEAISTKKTTSKIPTETLVLNLKTLTTKFIKKTRLGK